MARAFVPAELHGGSRLERRHRTAEFSHISAHFQEVSRRVETTSCTDNKPTLKSIYFLLNANTRFSADLYGVSQSFSLATCLTKCHAVALRVTTQTCSVDSVNIEVIRASTTPPTPPFCSSQMKEVETLDCVKVS